MKRKIRGSAKEAKATDAGAMPSTTVAATPRNAVITIGIASVIQRITTVARTAASRCAAGSTSSGRRHTTTNATGARNHPARWRQNSKRASAALTVPSISIGAEASTTEYADCTDSTIVLAESFDSRSTER